jgi:nucleoside-diphosphate-sugar epimerase
MGQMTILVTGAAGFVGGAVMQVAQARGHQARGLVRAQADLATDDLGPLLDGIDGVIHCAASLHGDDAIQARDTVMATQRLVAAIAAMPVPARMVLVSSMNVYAGDLPPWSKIDENTAIEPFPALRDAYTRAKLAQEAAVIAAGLPHCIARVGAVWGPGKLWNAHLGIPLGPVLVRLGSTGEVPLAHVQNVALALVLAVEQGAGAVNVVDDDRPSPAQYVAALRQNGWPKLVLPLPWRLLDWLGQLPMPGKPGLLRRPVLRARMMPRLYANDRLHALGWKPVIGFAAGMKAAEGKP